MILGGGHRRRGREKMKKEDWEYIEMNGKAESTEGNYHYL